MREQMQRVITWEWQLLRSHPWLSAAVILIAGLVVTGAVLAAEPAAPGKADLEARHLDFLAWEAGSWDADITLHGMAGEDSSFRGEQSDEMGGCGQWLITDLSMLPGPSGEAASPYQGHGVLGFDPAEEKLVGIWVDSQTSWLAVAEGTVDARGRQLTLSVEGRNPATGDTMMQDYVTTRLGDDSRRLEIFIPMPDGSRFKVATIDYARRSGPHAAATGH